jgi:hypothetical protein
VNTTVQDEINLYVFAVRAALGDLPEALRDELLEDLPEHLAEVMADGEGSLTERIGSPEAYAEDLRGSAGFVDFVGGFPDPPARGWAFSWRRELGKRRDRAVVLLHRADVRLGPLFGYVRASEFLVLLRPAWWVLRGYLVAMVLALMLDGNGQPIGLLPRVGGSLAIAVVLLGGAILASIWFGRRSLRLAKWPRRAVYAGSAVLALVAFGGFIDADSDARGSYYSEVNYENPYSHVEDLFVYDERGKLVTNARIFDQNGDPVRLGTGYCYDEEAGYGVEVDRLTYPYCPKREPFRIPAAADPTEEPAEDPAEPGAPGDPVPVPSAAGEISPSEGAPADPSASPSAGPASPTPSAEKNSE